MRAADLYASAVADGDLDTARLIADVEGAYWRMGGLEAVVDWAESDRDVDPNAVVATVPARGRIVRVGVAPR